MHLNVSHCVSFLAQILAFAVSELAGYLPSLAALPIEGIDYVAATVPRTHWLMTANWREHFSIEIIEIIHGFMIQVRMLGQFSFPQFLQAENNPHSAWTSVKLFLLGHQSSPVVTPSRKQVWQLQMAIKDTDPVIFKSLGCSCYDHQSKISTWIPRPGTNFGCTVVTAQFLHIFTGVSGVGIALWLALFFTGCSFWRRFACFVEPLGGKKHENTHAQMQLLNSSPKFQITEVTGVVTVKGSLFLTELNGRSVLKTLRCLQSCTVPRQGSRNWGSETEFRITYFLSQLSYSWGLGCFGYQFKSFGPSGVLELHGRTCRHTGETFGNSEKNYRGKRPQM